MLIGGKKLFRRHIVVACCEKGHLVTVICDWFFLCSKVNDLQGEGAKNSSDFEENKKRHNLDKNKDADAFLAADLRKTAKHPARFCLCKVKHWLQDNWTHFQGHCGVIHLLWSAKANSQNRTTLALSGKVKTAFVTLRFTFFLRYLLQLLFFLFFLLPFSRSLW